MEKQIHPTYQQRQRQKKENEQWAKDFHFKIKIPFNEFKNRVPLIEKYKITRRGGEITIEGRILQCQKCGSVYKENYLMIRNKLIHCPSCGNDRFTAIAKYKKIKRKDGTIDKNIIK